MATTPPDHNERPFYGRVESIRGLGALMVAGYHFTGLGLHGLVLLQQKHWPDATPFQRNVSRLGEFLFQGQAAVMMFFVISGFVLRIALSHGPQSLPTAAARFTIGRIFRFYPMCTIALLMAVIQLPAGSVSTGVLVSNLLLIDVSLNSHLWAIQVELLMVPVILGIYFLERRFGPSVVVGIAVVTTGLAFTSWWAISRPLSIYMFSFVLGMAIPTTGRSIALALSPRMAAICAMMATVIFLSAGPIFGTYSIFATILQGYAATSLLCSILYRTELCGFRWMDSRLLRQLGLCAGSYYVLHMATISVGSSLAEQLVPGLWSAAAPGIVGLGVIVVWLAALTPIMWVSFHIVEAPGMALGKRLIRKLGLNPVTPQPVPAMESRRAA